MCVCVCVCVWARVKDGCVFVCVRFNTSVFVRTAADFQILRLRMIQESKSTLTFTLFQEAVSRSTLGL